MVASYIVELDAIVVEIVQDCNTVFVSFSVIRLGSSCSENEEFFESPFNQKKMLKQKMQPFPKYFRLVVILIITYPPVFDHSGTDLAPLGQLTVGLVPDF